ncbi:hypothetical protein DSO57_1019500 [Entomophthora muscae]|uniref:Uncharacterized protein n=1 Tax=Entomophthora muscae TaxID=34485 RepID=A0ACC2ST62_9FUNG|nr:hypothetical protein DSO57_1019500 [Entomophthora muscae]
MDDGGLSHCDRAHQVPSGQLGTLIGYNTSPIVGSLKIGFQDTKCKEGQQWTQTAEPLRQWGMDLPSKDQGPVDETMESINPVRGIYITPKS